MSGRDVKNQFLNEMYVLNDELLKLHDLLYLPKCPTIARIMIDKILQFEDCYGFYFYESFLGYYFIDLFKEVGIESVHDLNRELSFSKLKNLFLTILNKDQVYYYFKSCDFIKTFKISDLKEDIIDFIYEYINLQDHLSLEEQYRILNTIRTELTFFVDYEFAEIVMNQYADKQKCIKKNTR